jgi:hypothetical protein
MKHIAMIFTIPKRVVLFMWKYVCFFASVVYDTFNFVNSLLYKVILFCPSVSLLRNAFLWIWGQKYFLPCLLITWIPFYSWEDDSSSADRKLFALNNVHYYVLNLEVDVHLSQMNPAHTLTPSFFKIDCSKHIAFFWLRVRLISRTIAKPGRP